MFSLLMNQKAKLLDLIVLSQKNRQPDENPGAKLILQMTLTNDVLIEFDGSLRSFLFTRNGKAEDPQTSIEGVPQVSDAPNLTSLGSKVGSIKWHQDMTGYTVTVDLGLGGKRSNIELADCVLSKWKFTPKDGGTVDVKLCVDAPDVGEAQFGKLAKLKSREIEIRMQPPEVATDLIGDAAPAGNVMPFGKDGPEQDATDIFAAQCA